MTSILPRAPNIAADQKTLPRAPNIAADQKTSPNSAGMYNSPPILSPYFC